MVPIGGFLGPVLVNWVRDEVEASDGSGNRGYRGATGPLPEIGSCTSPFLRILTNSSSSLSPPVPNCYVMYSDSAASNTILSMYVVSLHAADCTYSSQRLCTLSLFSLSVTNSTILEEVFGLT